MHCTVIGVAFFFVCIPVFKCETSNHNGSQDCKDLTTDCLNEEARVTICQHKIAQVYCMKSCDICPVDGVWNKWSLWSSCSVTCGDGQMRRDRTCHFPKPTHRGKDCNGTKYETNSCSAQKCPVDGVWLHWSGWSGCSVTCGGGQMKRSRTCHFPEPGNRGHDCQGPNIDTLSCARQNCPVDGVWDKWSVWSSCSVTCGGGQIRRNRTCHFPEPINRGKECNGTKHETDTCSAQKCPVDGVWLHWSDWSGCSVTCGGGQMKRSRTCHFPEPGNRGHDCQGPKIDTRSCAKHNCPVDGVWLHWSDWSGCSVTCGGGQMKRSRTCHFPEPANRGHDCQGPNIDTLSCARQNCPVDGVWLHWSDWSGCSVTCGGGQMKRSRTCYFPEPANRGHDCQGPNIDTLSCAKRKCPVDGRWSKWSTWSHCSVSCDVGTKQRYRTCLFPPNSIRGKTCHGAKTESVRCSKISCPDAECQRAGGMCQGIEDYCHGYHREGICSSDSHCCVDMSDSEFVGCFGHLKIWGIDIGSSFSHRIDTRWLIYPGNMTIQYCINHCKSFHMQYAALEFQSVCQCSDSIPYKCQKITNNDCTARCGGDRETVCGDWAKVSLYRIL